MKKIKKGDTVRIITGRSKGSIGKISLVCTKTNRVIVEDNHLVKKHSKNQQDEKKNGINSIPAFISLSSVVFVDSSAPTQNIKIGFKYTDKKQKIRFNKVNGNSIDVIKKSTTPVDKKSVAKKPKKEGKK